MVKITIEADGKELVLSMDQAKKLYVNLKELFTEKADSQPVWPSVPWYPAYPVYPYDGTYYTTFGTVGIGDAQATVTKHFWNLS